MVQPPVRILINIVTVFYVYDILIISLYCYNIVLKSEKTVKQ